MYGCLGKYIQSFGEETEMKEDHLERLGVSGRTKVKETLQTTGESVDWMNLAQGA
jgi:hypothetical protein